MGACELTYIARQDIDVAKASRQHEEYKKRLAELGARVISLPPQPTMPDAVFVEDPVVVVDEVAVIARTGAESRRAEAASIARALEKFRPLRHMREPATLEGGDVMHVGKTIFVGLSPRTNQAGAGQMAAELEPLGYRVRAVPVRGCLHLKTACCYIGEDALLVNRDWVNTDSFTGLKLIGVAENEPWAANALRIAETVLMPASFPGTEAILRGAGFRVDTLDLSELRKAEGSVTCMSVLFDAPPQ
jgi:dimethylargininase